MSTDQVTSNTPQEAHQHLERAYTYEDNSELDNALRECELVIELAPRLAEAHNLRGIVLDGLGRSEEALAAYREAIRLDPTFHEAQENFSEAIAEMRERERTPQHLVTVRTCSYPLQAHLAAVDTITCPKCGTVNPADAMNCQQCRVNLEFALANPDMVKVAAQAVEHNEFSSAKAQTHGWGDTLARLLATILILALAIYAGAMIGSSLSAKDIDDTTNAKWESWGTPPAQVAKILDSGWDIATVRTVDGKAYHYDEQSKRWIETKYVRTLTGSSPCPKIPPAPVRVVNEFEYCTWHELGPFNAKYILGEDGKVWAWRNRPNDYTFALVSGLQWGALLGFLTGGVASILIWKIRL